MVIIHRSPMPQLKEANIPCEGMIGFKERKLSGTS
jgi:hypothetical protein